jgi:prolyl oligopeptidase
MRFNHRCLITPVVIVSASLAAAAPPPVASVSPVTDEYFGTQVTDNYRYFEDLKNPQVQAWMKGQAQYARAVLDSIPGRKALLERITALDKTEVEVFDVQQRGERYFYQKRTPEDQVPRLYYRDGLGGAEHMLLDPERLGTAQAHAALDFYAPSWDGKLLAYGVSLGGSEESVVHVLDVAGERTFKETIDRTSNNVMAWAPDNRGFFYFRYRKPAPGAKPGSTLYNARAYRHVLGENVTGDGDPAVLGRGVASNLEVPEGQAAYLILSPDSPYALGVANQNLDQNPSTLYIARLDSINGAATPWRRVAGVSDQVTQFQLQGEYLYFLTSKGAPRFKLARVPLSHPDLAQASVVLPQSRAVLTGFAIASDGVYVSARDGAVTRVLRTSVDGAQQHDLPTPFKGTASIAAADSRQSGVLLDLTGWVEPERLYRYEPAGNTTGVTDLIPAPSLDTSPFMAEEVFATSYDGTRVPLSIVRQKNAPRDGARPTLLVGYGSYGDSIDPVLRPALLAWIERGGLLALAHVRGGGEYGEAWHKGGQKLTKLNTVFDFIACAEYLITAHYTAPKYLEGEGTSAGGILIGGALTWRPDLFAVAIDNVGMTDTLRFELTPNGPSNTGEFGSVKTEEGFHGLYAMSAYAHVRDGTAYPAVLLHTGANDPRVEPWIIAKMAARLQAASTSGKPILLDVDYDAGHGIGSRREQRLKLYADQMAFALWQFGDPGFQPTEATVSQTAAPSTDARQQLLDLEKEWVAAENRNDVTVLRRILDDKFVLTYGGKTYDKEAFLRVFTGDVDPTKSQTLTYEAVSIDGDTAVLVGTDTERGTSRGVAYTAVGRYTATYIRRQGQWRALAEQMVILPQPN